MTGKSATIMLVDDEEGIKTALHDHLSDAGDQVVSASSGDDAMSIVDGLATIDLIITDIMMPGKANGFDLIEYARRRRPEIRTIAMSGFVGSDSARIDLADTFLAKPFTFVALEWKIDQIWGSA